MKTRDVKNWGKFIDKLANKGMGADAILDKIYEAIMDAHIEMHGQDIEKMAYQVYAENC